MVCFSGEISKEIQKKMIRIKTRFAGLMILPFILAFGALFFIFGLWENEKYRSVGIILVLGAVLCIYALIAPVTNARLRVRWSGTVRVNENTVSYTPADSELSLEKPIGKIKRVLDYGDFYCVIFSDIGNAFLCQKDLLAEGSLEEFERIFSEKIIRK